MRKFLVALLTVPIMLIATVLVASPAQAATQPLFGTTVDVTIAGTSTSLLGGTGFAGASGGSVLATLGASLSANVDFMLLEGATVLGSCTIFAGSTQCATYASVSSGSHAVTSSFTQSGVTVQYTGTLFAVISAAPTVSVEWQDASSGWVNGVSTTVLLHGPIAFRCVVTNNGNAPFVFGPTGFTGGVTSSGGGSGTVPITGTLAAGATGYYPLWSGSATQSPTGSCGGGVVYPDGMSNGAGASGGVSWVGGTFDVTPLPAPGHTVTVTGTALSPPVIQSYPVTLDGVNVADSPGLTIAPDFDFAVDVVIPANLASGSHVIAVHSLYGGRDTILAQFTFQVLAPASPAPAVTLAATGVDATASLGIGVLVLLLGAGLVLASRRRRGADWMDGRRRVHLDR